MSRPDGQTAGGSGEIRRAFLRPMLMIVFTQLEKAKGKIKAKAKETGQRKGGAIAC